MRQFIRKAPYTGPVKAVVLDWAGTAVDFGCMGPAAVFVEVFRECNIEVSVACARQFMGLEKKRAYPKNVQSSLRVKGLAGAVRLPC